MHSNQNINVEQIDSTFSRIIKDNVKKIVILVCLASSWIIIGVLGKRPIAHPLPIRAPSALHER